MLWSESAGGGKLRLPHPVKLEGGFFTQVFANERDEPLVVGLRCKVAGITLRTPLKAVVVGQIALALPTTMLSPNRFGGGLAVCR